MKVTTTGLLWRFEVRNGWRPLREARVAGYTSYDSDKHQVRVLLWVRREGASTGVIVERQEGLVPMVDYRYGMVTKVDAWHPLPLGPTTGKRRKKK